MDRLESFISRRNVFEARCCSTPALFAGIVSEVEADGIVAEQYLGRLVEKAFVSRLDPLFLAAHLVVQFSVVRLSNELLIVRTRLV